MGKYDLAICISTYNRPESFEKCIDSFLKHTHVEIPIFVVDDCSPDIYCNADYRFAERSGISKVKNKSLQLCYESGKSNFLLLDDDTKSLCNDWHLPYLEALQNGFHHLCRTFLPLNRIVNKMVDQFDDYGNMYQDNISIKFHILSNGCAMFYSKECIDAVGGFDTNYNNKYEHCDLSRRIFNAGLTKYIYQDVINSNELIYCLDQDNAIQRSFTDREMQDNLKSGYDYFRSQAKSNRYIEFRT